MKKRNTVILISLFATSVFLPGCYKDEAVKPDATFEILSLDASGNQVPVKQVTVEQRVLFRCIGTGEYFVVWPGEKRVNFSGSVFRFTDESFKSMKQSLVPDELIDKLKDLKGTSYTSESKLSWAIFNRIGNDNFYAFEYQIKASAFTPFKSAAGNDSVPFAYNYDYDDHIQAIEKGLYNINGWPLTEDAGLNYSYTHIYRLPGLYKVKMVALGIKDYGESSVSDVKEMELSVLQKK